MLYNMFKTYYFLSFQWRATPTFTVIIVIVTPKDHLGMATTTAVIGIIWSLSKQSKGWFVSGDGERLVVGEGGYGEGKGWWQWKREKVWNF